MITTDLGVDVVNEDSKLGSNGCDGMLVIVMSLVDCPADGYHFDHNDNVLEGYH